MQTNEGIGQFQTTCIQLNAITAFALFSTSMDLQRDDTFGNSSVAVDSSHLGDSFDGACKILARGDLRPSVLFPYESQPLRALYDEYQRCDMEPVMDTYTAKRPVAKNVGVWMIAKTSTPRLGPALSPFSHVVDPSVGRRTNETWPNIPSGNISTPITCSRRIASMGGHRLWKRR